MTHVIYSLCITNLVQERKAGMASIKVSRLHLVDLAGSERQKDTHAEGLRLKVNFIYLFIFCKHINLLKFVMDVVRLIVSVSVGSGFY